MAIDRKGQVTTTGLMNSPAKTAVKDLSLQDLISYLTSLDNTKNEFLFLPCLIMIT